MAEHEPGDSVPEQEQEAQSGSPRDAEAETEELPGQPETDPAAELGETGFEQGADAEPDAVTEPGTGLETELDAEPTSADAESAEREAESEAADLADTPAADPESPSAETTDAAASTERSPAEADPSPEEPSPTESSPTESSSTESSPTVPSSEGTDDAIPPPYTEPVVLPPVKEPGPIKRFLARPWVGPVAVILGFVTVASAVLIYNPTNEVGPTTCALKLMTGFDCPGCGGTRAFYYTLTLNLPEAARNHAMALFAAPFLTWMFAQWAVPRLFPRLGAWRWPVFMLTPRITFWFLGVWAVYWIARNLPWVPFTHLYV